MEVPVFLFPDGFAWFCRGKHCCHAPAYEEENRDQHDSRATRPEALAFHTWGNTDLRQLEEMMAERGVVVDHSAVHRWALELLPVRRVVLIAAEPGLLSYTGTVRHCLRSRCAG